MSTGVPLGERARAAALLVAWGLAALAGAIGAQGWRMNNGPSAWAGEAGLTAEGDRLLAERFGGDELVLARADRFATTETDLEALAHLGEELRSLPAVASAFDPLALPGAPAGTALDRFRAAASRPLVEALDAVRLDPPHIDWLLTIDPSADPRARAALADGLERLRTRSREAGRRLRVAGHPLVSAALDRETARVEGRFLPLFALSGLLVTAWFLRSGALALAVLLPAIAAATCGRAVLRLLGIDANMILVALGPLALVLTLAALLHLVSAYRRRLSRGDPPARAARAARREILASSLLALATTVLGFGVFLFSPVAAVRHLGAAVALDLAIVIPLGLATLPTVLAGCRPSAKAAAGRPARRWRRLAAASVRRRPLALLAAGALLVAAPLAARRLSWGTDVLLYFPAGHSLRTDFRSIEAEGGAGSTLAVLVERSAAVDDEAEKELEGLLGTLPFVRGVFGPPDVRRDVATTTGGLGEALLVPAALRRAGRLDRTGELLRFSLRIPSLTLTEMQELSTRLGETAGRWGERHGVRTWTAGSVRSLLELQRHLVFTMGTSLGLTSLVVILAFALVARARRAFLGALVANALPVAGVFVAAAALRFPLDAATVMVASVVLGLAVDNTFHLLRRDARARSPLRRLRAFGAVGEPGAVGTLALVAGFSILALSGFAPTVHFGTLAALGVALAFAADFLVLPAIWVRRADRGASEGKPAAPALERVSAPRR